MGYDLWHCELHSHGRRTLLRIDIDVMPTNNNEAKSGIKLEDCRKVSKQVSALLDVEDLIAGGYELEVSSPGLDRRLYTLEHYRRFIGHLVHVSLYEPIGEAQITTPLPEQHTKGRHNFTGHIQSVTDNYVNITIDTATTIAIAIDKIKKANLVPNF